MRYILFFAILQSRVAAVDDPFPGDAGSLSDRSETLWKESFKIVDEKNNSDSDATLQSEMVLAESTIWPPVKAERSGANEVSADVSAERSDWNETLWKESFKILDDARSPNGDEYYAEFSTERAILPPERELLSGADEADVSAAGHGAHESMDLVLPIISKQRQPPFITNQFVEVDSNTNAEPPIIPSISVKRPVNSQVILPIHSHPSNCRSSEELRSDGIRVALDHEGLLLHRPTPAMPPQPQQPPQLPPATVCVF